MEKKMEPEYDLQPMVRVKTKSGMIYYPKFEKNTRGKWTPVDPSFQKMNKKDYLKDKKKLKEKLIQDAILKMEQKYPQESQPGRQKQDRLRPSVKKWARQSRFLWSLKMGS